MFRFIRTILPGDKKASICLKIEDENYKNARAEVKEDTLFLDYVSSANDKKSKKLSVGDIRDIRLMEGVLSFVCDSQRYTISGYGLEVVQKYLSPFRVDIEKLFTANAVKYYTFNYETKIFVEKGEDVCVDICHSDKYYLRISNEKEMFHIEEITTDVQYYADQSNSSFVWSVFSDNIFNTFCIKFSDNITFLEFRSKFLDASYRSNFELNENSPTTTLDKLYSGIADYSVDNASSEEDENEEDDAWEEMTSEKTTKKDTGKEDTNKHLVVANDQCYVTRGQSLGVFNLEPNGLKFRTHIQHAVNDPKKIMTHNGNTNLLILEKEVLNKLGLMDLSRGEVIERWDMKTDINDCFNTLKSDNAGTLIGVSDYSLFRIDPRTKEKIVERKDYKTKNMFSVGAAASNGNFAVGSGKGDLRLYDKVGKRAKSLLPGFGDSFIGIDTSADGSLILCTCKSYILLFKASSNYSKNTKEPPKRLQLRPQHLGHIGNEISFTPAKFDSNDTLIITGTGRYVIKWRVKDVLEGKVYNYSLRALSDQVVDEDFVFNGKDIVVALKNDVRKISESDLKRPERGPTI